jgi:hypothetical protein
MTTSWLAYEVGTSGAKVVGKVGSIDAALDFIAKTEQSSIHTNRGEEKKNSQQGFAVFSSYEIG